MRLYSSGDKSIKISYDFQEKYKELDSQELPLSPLQDPYWPSWFHKLKSDSHLPKMGFFYLLQ